MDDWPAKPELSVPEQPLVAQLYYQPVKRDAITPAADIERLKHIVITASIDGNAHKLATALRDLQAHGIGITDELLVMAGGSTPLHLAVEADRPATLAVLVDAGCDVNARNRVGDTSAHIAARNNFTNCIRLLGSPHALADFSLQDAKGNSAEEVAELSGHTETVDLIRELVKTDEDVHMVKRRAAEVVRQQQMVRLKERLYGRSFLSLEGGPEFDLPPRALLNAENRWAMGAGVRAFATVPVVLEKGVNKALSQILAKSRAELARENIQQTQQHHHHNGMHSARESFSSFDSSSRFGANDDSFRSQGYAATGAGAATTTDDQEEEEVSGAAAGDSARRQQFAKGDEFSSRLGVVNLESAIARSRAGVLGRVEDRAAGEVVQVKVSVLSVQGLPKHASSSSFVELSFLGNKNGDGGGIWVASPPPPRTAGAVGDGENYGDVGVENGGENAGSIGGGENGGDGDGAGANGGVGDESLPVSTSAATPTEEEEGVGVVVGLRTAPMAQKDGSSCWGPMKKGGGASSVVLLEVDAKAARGEEAAATSFKARSAAAATATEEVRGELRGQGGRSSTVTVNSSEDRSVPFSSRCLPSGTGPCDLVASVYVVDGKPSVDAHPPPPPPPSYSSASESSCVGTAVLHAAGFLLAPPTAPPQGGSWGPFVDDTDDGVSNCNGDDGGDDGDNDAIPGIGWQVTAPLRSTTTNAVASSGQVSSSFGEEEEQGCCCTVTLGISVVSSSRQGRGGGGGGGGEAGFGYQFEHAGDSDDGASQETDKHQRYDDFEDDGEEDFIRDFIPGRISESRWIDLSRGRPPDLGYSSCV